MKSGIVELHQVADNKLVEIDNFLPQFWKREELFVPAGPTSPKIPIVIYEMDTELFLPTLRARYERRKDHIARVEGFGHISILSEGSSWFLRWTQFKDTTGPHRAYLWPGNTPPDPLFLFRLLAYTLVSELRSIQLVYNYTEIAHDRFRSVRFAQRFNHRPIEP